MVGRLRSLCGGWVGVENEINANSTFNQVVIEVEVELGNHCSDIFKDNNHNKLSYLVF